MSQNQTYYALKMTYKQAELALEILLDAMDRYKLPQASKDRLDNMVNRLGAEITKTNRRINVSEKGTKHLI